MQKAEAKMLRLFVIMGEKEKRHFLRDRILIYGGMQMKLTTKIRMDLEKPGSTPIIHGVQSDSCIKRLEIALYRDRMPCVLSENFRVLVRYRKPNKMGGEYDTLPDGTSAWNIWGNRVTLSLVPQLFTTPGTVSLTVTLIGDGGQFSLYPILLFVQSVACADIAESENYFYVTGFLPAPRTANAGNYLD